MSFQELIHRQKATHNLFCFPYAGGSAQCFNELAQALPIDMALYAYELPGRGERFGESLVRDYTLLLEEIYPALINNSRGKPFSLFGHSNGGLFAYALGQKLLATDIKPQAIFISAEAPPHVTEFNTDPISYSNDEIKKLLHKYGGTTAELVEDPDFLDFFSPIMNSDLSINYRMKLHLQKTSIEKELIIIIGQQDKTIDPKCMEEWEQYTNQGIKKNYVNSDHFFINSHSMSVAHIIQQEINFTCGVL